MMKRLMIASAMFVLAACSQPAPSAEENAKAPGAETVEVAAVAGSSAAAPAGGEDTIIAWARRTYNSPADRISLIEPVTIFWGDFTGDGAPDALAWADFDTGGSSWNHGVGLFRNEGGRMVFMRTEDEVYGMEPRDPHFETGKITLTTSMPGPNDPLCCPTQARAWVINTR